MTEKSENYVSIVLTGGGWVNFMKIPNYTGPYISNGKFQESVAFGSAVPQDALDALSRLHDTAYATYKDIGHRTAADSIYNKEAQKLAEVFPQLAGNLVLYGNQAGRSAYNIVSGYASSGPLGALYGGIKNMYNLNDYVVNERRYNKDILDLYDTDPFKGESMTSLPSGSESIGEPSSGGESGKMDSISDKQFSRRMIPVDENGPGVWGGNPNVLSGKTALPSNENLNVTTVNGKTPGTSQTNLNSISSEYQGSPNYGLQDFRGYGMTNEKDSFSWLDRLPMYNRTKKRRNKVYIC